MSSNRARLLLLAGASFFAFTSQALAQAAGAPDGADVEAVVVTGSRVISNGNASPTPLTVVNTEALLKIQPGPVAESLALLPAFAGSRTGVGNPGSGTSNAGAQHLNLRYLGYLRTLVLFDGKRVPPTTFDQVVDISMVPQMLLQRVDLVTGGVSAVYGSDAVSGVVNFVPDYNFNGLRMDLEAGISNYGDNRTLAGGIAAGTRMLNDRGHIEVSYAYRDDPGVLRRSARAWGRNVWTVNGLGTTASPFRLIQNTRISTASFGGLITNATGTGTGLNNQTFDSNGVLSPFVNGAATGATGVQSGGSGAYYDSSIKAALESHQGFARFDYEINDTTDFYLQGAYTQNRTLTYEQYNRLTNLTMSGTNAFLPANYQFNGTFRFNKFMRDLPRISTDSLQKQYFVIAGLKGKAFGDYDWEVSATQSRARSTTVNAAQIDQGRLFAALDAVRDPAGQVVCRVTLTNPGLYQGCVPMNVFGPTSSSQAAVDYITRPSGYETTNGMTDIAGSISGSPFDVWAGPVQVALSGEWRRQTLSLTSDAQPTDRISCTGLMFNCTGTATPRWMDPVLANLDKVSMRVAEVAGETEIPLVRDQPLFKDLSFNGAVRYTHYNTSGKAWTWKLGLTWQMTDEVKLRGTRSRDIRAPTLYDLFAPQGVNTNLITDLLTNVQVNVPTFSGGNPGLTPEIGNTVTAGVVYQPEWLPRFSISMDAYHIRVTNALVSQDGGNSSAQALCYQSGGASTLCSLQQRPLGFTNTTAANAATAFFSRQINIAEMRTYGADFEANYAATLAGNPLSLRALVTWQPHLTQDTPGSLLVEGAGRAFASTGAGGAFAVPRVRVSLFADYTVGGLRLSLRERWRSNLTLQQAAGRIYAEPDDIGAAAYTDVALSYRFTRAGFTNSEIYLNVQNVFNRQPAPAAGSGQAARAGSFGGFALGDDPIGRYFTLGLRLKR